MVEDAPLKVLSQVAAAAGWGEAGLPCEGAVCTQVPNQPTVSDAAHEPAGSPPNPQGEVRPWPLTMRYILAVSGSL